MCMSSSAPEVKAGPMELAMVELSENQLEHYEQTYEPLVRDRVSEAQELGGSGAKQHNANVLARTPRQGRGAFNPAAGAAPALKQGIANKGITDAGTVALATSQGELISKNEEVAAKLGITQIGRGQSQTASQTYGNLAANEYAENITNANADAAVAGAQTGAIGTAVGAGAGYWLNKPTQPKKNNPKSAYIGLGSNQYNNYV